MNNTSPFAGWTAGRFAFDGTVSTVELNGNFYPIEWQISDTANLWQCDTPAGRFTLRVEQNGSRRRFFPTAQLAEVPESCHFCLIKLPVTQIDHFYGCGNRMGRHKSHKLPVKNQVSGLVYYHTALTRDGETVLISTPLTQSSDNYVEYTLEDNLLTDFQLIYEIRHCDRTSWEFDPVTIAAGDGIQLLEGYGKDNADPAKTFTEKPVLGWNSWDYYRWTINEDEVIKNAEFIAKDPVLSQHIKRIIVDDGWQYCYGEWEANSYFPSGMKNLADRIRKMNFIPGLWFAPAIVEPHAYIAQMDYHMLACSEGGQPCLCYECMKRMGFVLDPTVPQTREWLKKLFDRYASMGYGYFKLDFLAATMNAARFADRNVPRSRILPMLMQAVADGVNNRAVLLGCNYAFSNGTSLVDSVRVGGDIHARWDCICRNTVPVATSFWANRRLWWNDPDFAVCRGVDTSDDPDLNRLSPMLIAIQAQSSFQEMHNYQMGTATLSELEILLSISLMAAGMINLSDNMPRLNAIGLNLARKVVSAAPGHTGIPLDMFSTELPVYWKQQLFNGNTRLLVINWGDDAREIPIDWRKINGERPTQLRDFWHDTVSYAEDVVVLPPHSCRLYEF